MTLILASASPRRREILASLGVPFDIRVVETDETCDLQDPGARVEAISGKKCRAVVDDMTAKGELTLDHDTLVLASDTLVVLDGVFLGKPKDAEDAYRMVEMLQGKTHVVASGIALWHQGKMVTSHELTKVTFAPMSAEEIRRYVATGEPFGKAGAYAIQGHASRYITGIEGDYFNVVGLPTRRLYATLRDDLGIEI